MKTCYLCSHAAESQQAMDWGKMYDGLDVDCSHCGIYRISGILLHLNNLSESFKKEYSKFLNERSDEEKRKIYWVTSDGVKPNQN